MNADRFDAVVQAITATLPRRATLSGVLGAGLAGLLSHLGLEDAEGRKKRRRRRQKKCKGGTTKCGKRCRDLATDGVNCGACQHDCIAGTCERGACLCAGQQDCPLGCYCAPRLGAQDVADAACIANGIVGEECQSDGDCPFRTVCLINSRCSAPCLL